MLLLKISKLNDPVKISLSGNVLYFRGKKAVKRLHLLHQAGNENS
jgi:hypothetical protein